MGYSDSSMQTTVLQKYARRREETVFDVWGRFACKM